MFLAIGFPADIAKYRPVTLHPCVITSPNMKAEIVKDPHRIFVEEGHLLGRVITIAYLPTF